MATVTLKTLNASNMELSMEKLNASDVLKDTISMTENANQLKEDVSMTNLVDADVRLLSSIKMVNVSYQDVPHMIGKLA